MNDYNKKDEKKGGAIPGILGSGSSSAGGASGFGASGLGSSGGWLGGLFASKAGILGAVLGSATIAAGVGVVYNFIGPSSKPVYNPDLFQNTYYEEEAGKASQERALSRDASAAASSTLDIFREQAKKDGLAGLAGEGGEGGSASSEEPSAADAAADASAAAPAADAGASAPGAGSGGPKLQASSGFGSKGGGAGSGTSIPRMQGAGGGLSGGIGGQFQPVYRPPAQANAGKTSAMTANAARIKNSPKYAVPNVNKKGAYGQAKFAGKMGSKAAFSADSAGARTGATEAFSGETSGAGDVAGAGGGAGLGGAGVSNGPALKGNDPSLSSNESTPPKVPDPEDVDPWQKYEDMAMNSMMWAGGLILVAKLLSKLAKSAGAFGVYLYYAAMAAAAAAIFFALKVIYAGFKMMTEFGQKMMGGIYMLTGAILIWKAWEALSGAYSDANPPSATVTGGETAGGMTLIDGGSGMAGGDGTMVA